MWGPVDYVKDFGPDSNSKKEQLKTFKQKSNMIDLLSGIMVSPRPS